MWIALDWFHLAFHVNPASSPNRALTRYPEACHVFVHRHCESRISSSTGFAQWHSRHYSITFYNDHRFLTDLCHRVSITCRAMTLSRQYLCAKNGITFYQVKIYKRRERSGKWIMKIKRATNNVKFKINWRLIQQSLILSKMTNAIYWLTQWISKTLVYVHAYILHVNIIQILFCIILTYRVM